MEYLNQKLRSEIINYLGYEPKGTLEDLYGILVKFELEKKKTKILTTGLGTYHKYGFPAEASMFIAVRNFNTYYNAD